MTRAKKKKKKKKGYNSVIYDRHQATFSTCRARITLFSKFARRPSVSATAASSSAILFLLWDSSSFNSTLSKLQYSAKPNRGHSLPPGHNGNFSGSEGEGGGGVYTRESLNLDMIRISKASKAIKVKDKMNDPLFRPHINRQEAVRTTSHIGKSKRRLVTAKKPKRCMGKRERREAQSSCSLEKQAGRETQPAY